MLTRKPDLAEAFTEGNGINDAFVSMTLEKDVLRVFLKAEISQPRFVRLRWIITPSEKRNEPVHVMEESWERGYGTLKWRGIDSGEATPWTFAVSNGTDADPDVVVN